MKLSGMFTYTLVSALPFLIHKILSYRAMKLSISGLTATTQGQFNCAKPSHIHNRKT